MDASTPSYKRSDLKTFGYCLIVSIAICTFGLDSGETSGFLAMPSFLQDFGNYEPAFMSYAMSAGDQTRMYGLEVGAIALGSLSAGWLGPWSGYKYGLLVASIFCMLGPGLQMIPNTPGLLIGRMVMGYGVGLAAVFCIAYWSEVCSANLRGQVVVLYQVFLTTSSFIGACINQGTYTRSTASAYQIPLGVSAGLPFIFFLLIWLIPESPRWLISQGRHEDARVSIKRLRGDTFPEDEIDQELKEIVSFTAIEQEISSSSSYKECFTGLNLRRTLITLFLFPGQQLMGVGFLSGYLTYFFALAGVSDEFLITVISSACSLAGALSTFGLNRVFGRRQLLIVGAAVNATCMLTFAIVAVAAPGSDASSKCLIAFICIFLFSYSATWGTTVPLVVGEIPSNRLRVKTISLALSVSFILSMAVICGVPYLINPLYANLGTKVGFIFGGLTIPLVFLSYFFLPETKGRSLEEIDEMFLNSVSSRSFATYICTGQVQNISSSQIFELVTEKVDLKMVEKV